MLGANGAGKSSLLKALGGMVTPQAGASAQLAGQELMQLPPHAIVQSGLALVPEGAACSAISASRKTCCWVPSPARTHQ